ncbi:AAA family ATPase [Sphingobacterium spiritivorum]|uniref:AAA family ATPase n=1 Tax=Sphingobacterium spiritivorum TaxID=258 RepID=UPI003DA5E5C0
MEKPIKEVMLTEPSLQNLSPTTESYNDVELTDDERESVIKEALEKAKKAKIAQIRSKEYWDRVNNPPEPPKFSPQQTFEYFLTQAKALNKNFLINDYNRSIIELLSLYFSNDPKFEESGYKLNKGIMLVGPVGCGKTTIMKAFGRNTTNSFAIIACRKVSQDYTDKNNGGSSSIEKYSNMLSSYPQMNFGQDKIGYCFDDLGTENIKKHFGNDMDVMAEIIYSRYDSGLAKHTHFTANLTSTEIEDTYGSRVRSRLREMCNFISFDTNSPDFRI